MYSQLLLKLRSELEHTAESERTGPAVITDADLVNKKTVNLNYSQENRIDSGVMQ